MNDEIRPQRWTFFASMYDVLKDKERKKPRVATCSKCKILMVYKLAQLDEATTTVQCVKCGAKIQI